MTNHTTPRQMVGRRAKPPAPRIKPKPVEGTTPKTRPFDVTGKRATTPLVRPEPADGGPNRTPGK